MNTSNLTLRPGAIGLVVYDLDGTLVDAFADIWTGVNHALRTAGLPTLPYETVKSFVGDGARMLIRRSLGPERLDRYDEVYPLYREYYAAHPIDQARLYPGVAETLDRLRALGFRQAILTNKPDEVTRQICDAMGLTGRVEGIWGELPGEPRKPDPESLAQVVRHFGLTPAQAILVGDGPADHEVARAAGMPLVAVTWGLLSGSQAALLDPAAVIDEISELPDLLTGHPVE